MDKIISFEDFLNKASEIAEEDNMTAQEGHDGHEGQEPRHYMFFQNLASIKHYVNEILTMDPAKVDALLQDGHDWAADHITSSKDDVQEVAEWLRNSMEEQKASHSEEVAEPEPEKIDVMIDDTEVEGGEKEGEEEEEDDEE